MDLSLSSRYEIFLVENYKVSSPCLISAPQIVYSLDEVAFVQNLVFYIESAYCIPVTCCPL